MKRPQTCLSLIILGLLVAAIGSCASRPKSVESAPSAVAAESHDAAASSIQAEATGLAPAGDARFQQIDFAISFGNGDAVKTWVMAISDKKKTVRTMNGDATSLPEKISWDGKTDSGAQAPEGNYNATLGIDYGEAFKKSSASSKPFLLDINPPMPSFSPNPAKFTYSPDGVTKPISTTISVKAGLAKVKDWTIDVYDETGTRMTNLGGTWPDAQVGWDGKTDQGMFIEAAKSYLAVLTVKDEYGNAGSFKGSFSVVDVPGAEKSTIAPMRTGFSPTSTSVKNTLDLLITVGSKASVQDWMVQVMSAAMGAVKSFKGGPAGLPEYTRWDGKDDSGNPAPEGSYYAVLAINYGKAYMPSLVKSGPFFLVTTPPEGSIVVDPPTAALSTLGPKNPVNLTVQAKSSFAQIASWTMGIFDDKGGSIASFQANWPNNKVAWDGKSVLGQALVPGAAYTLSAKVQDEYGNVGELNGTLAIDELAPPTEPSAVQALSAGFAPTGDDASSQEDFSFEIGNPASVDSCKVDIVDDSGSIARSFSGVGKAYPSMLSWDGRKANGEYAPEGKYKAVLTVGYGVAFAPICRACKEFVLDLTPPEGTIGLSTDLFSPDGDGTNDTVTITLEGSSKLARIVGWSMTIYDPARAVFVSKEGTWPANPIVWDGKDANGDLIESASAYPIDVKLRDEFGNVGEIRKDLNTDILVLRMGDGYRIRVSSIYFKSFTADYKNVSRDRAGQNSKTLDLLAAKLAKFPEYRIKLEGHAVMINWDNKAKGNAEQKSVLIPLSEARAKSIKDALVERGLSGDRLIATGVGAKDPVVPNSDYANRWKNRRVEFYLVK
ncbi:MAG: FlgD immunoglobulin-like domain containing protein [Rectinemataceae bacterium]|jgi:outer membrane protein OmpA-like peptidoglycan-associated protein/flagellar hook assembly protein FlgD